MIQEETWCLKSCAIWISSGDKNTKNFNSFPHKDADSIWLGILKRRMGI